MEELHTLVQAAQEGDMEAFGRIVTRFQNMAYAGAYALLGDFHLAQDAAQEAFIDAYLSLPQLRQPAAFPGWFRRIVFKHSHRLIRGKRVEMAPVESAVSLPSPLPDPLAIVVRREARQTVHEAIATLPEGQRLVTTLFYISGYSQKEIAAFLEIPVSTIKKRLHTARKRLKKRMIIMVKEKLQEHKPSQDEQFASKVQFFIALRAGDIGRLEKLVARDPGLLKVKTEWPAASNTHYWPLGATPIYVAAGMENEALLAFLLDQGADVDGRGAGGRTPLHHAVIMRQSGMARLLLARGANVNAATDLGHTPLHFAAIYNNQEMIALLLAHGADEETADKRGYTAADWTAMLARRSQASPKSAASGAGRRVPVGEAVAGRWLDGSGRPIDGRPSPNGGQPIYRAINEIASPILETGIKIIDLFAPLKRGGQNAVFTPLSGVGRMLITSQIMMSVAALYDGYVVYLGLEEEEVTAASLVKFWRSCGVPEEVITGKLSLVFGRRSDSIAQRRQLAETGLTIAENCRRQGREVLLVVDNKVALTDGVLPYLKGNTAVTPEAAVTTLYDGDHTVGVEPEAFAHLDAIITFNQERARQKLWPAVDPLLSRSNLLQRSDLPDETHTELVARIQRLFRRYHGLHYQVEYAGLDALFYFDDRAAAEQTVVRARRLHRFLTQPMPGLETLTGLPGARVSLADTIAGCQGILDGRYDDVAEDAFYFIGAIGEVTG